MEFSWIFNPISFDPVPFVVIGVAFVICVFTIVFVVISLRELGGCLDSDPLKSDQRKTMRAPSLLSQCLPGLLPHDKASHCVNVVSEKDLHLPSPAVEIIPSKVSSCSLCSVSNCILNGASIYMFGLVPVKEYG